MLLSGSYQCVTFFKTLRCVSFAQLASETFCQFFGRVLWQRPETTAWGLGFDAKVLTMVGEFQVPKYWRLPVLDHRPLQIGSCGLKGVTPLDLRCACPNAWDDLFTEPVAESCAYAPRN